MYTVDCIASVSRIMEELGCTPDVALDIQTDRLSVSVSSNHSKGRKIAFVTGNPEQGITVIFES